MHMDADGERALVGVVGRRIEAASSSLTQFAVALDGGLGLLAWAQAGADGATVAVSAPSARRS